MNLIVDEIGEFRVYEELKAQKNLEDLSIDLRILIFSSCVLKLFDSFNAYTSYEDNKQGI